MRQQHTILLLSFLLFLLLLQNASAENRASSSSLHDDHFPSARQTPSKSNSDQLLLITSAESHQISEKSLLPPQDNQDSSNQKGWFGKLKSKAKDSLNNAKEAIYSHIPHSVTEHARNIGNKAKGFPEAVANQAGKMTHTAEEIYEKVSSKLTKEIKHQTEPDLDIPLAADFIDQDQEGNAKPVEGELSTSAASEELSQKKGIFSTFRQKISDVSNSVKNKVKYTSISQSFSNKFKSLKEKTENLLHAPSRVDLKGTFSNIGNRILAIPQKISQKYSEITQSSNNTSWFSQSWDKITQKIKKAIPTTIPLKEKIASVYQQVKDRAFPSVSNLFVGAKDSISRFGGTAKRRFAENFDKIAQKIKQAIPTTIPFQEKISSAYQQVKDRTIPSVSNFFKGAKDSISRFGSSAKGKLTEALDFAAPKILAPISGIMNFGSWMWNLMAWRKLLYWFIGFVIGCLFLKAFLFLLPFIQMTVSILKTPFQVMFMLNSLVRQFYPKANPEDGSQRQTSEPAEVKNQAEHPKEKDRSYYRYSSSQEEWQRRNQHGLHEPTRPRDLDSGEVRRRFEERQENEERYYNYYRCYGCNQQWENVTIGKGPVQECKNEKCKYAFGPYHQIPLLNNKQKKEEFEKVKSE